MSRSCFVSVRAVILLCVRIDHVLAVCEVWGPGVRDYVPGPDPDMAINLADEPNPGAPVAPASGSSTEQVLSPAAADVAAKAPPSKDAFVLEQVVDPVPAPQPTAEPTVEP